MAKAPFGELSRLLADFLLLTGKAVRFELSSGFLTFWCSHPRSSDFQESGGLQTCPLLRGPCPERNSKTAQRKTSSSGRGIQEQGFESSGLGQTWGCVSFRILADSLIVTPGTSTLPELLPLLFPAAGDVGRMAFTDLQLFQTHVPLL